MADDLIAFVRARLDEDEVLAKAAMEHWPFSNVDSAASIPGNGPAHVWAYVTAHDPARALREVARNRGVVERHVPFAIAGYTGCSWCENEDATPWPCPDVRDLAAVYGYHPDYRQEWLPDVPRA